jgi:hypothetical protein
MCIKIVYSSSLSLYANMQSRVRPRHPYCLHTKLSVRGRLKKVKENYYEIMRANIKIFIYFGFCVNV